MTELLRIATVDNFQGEEAKVIIISLVRSNMDSKVGFLKTSNRINVLLSRAKHGMYLIGNSRTYANVPMWSKLGMLRMTDSVGSKFSLHCDRHQETDAMVATPED
jgi:superfamily I DNA and/or RNA helicase